MSSTLATIKNFYRYQKERFPILILAVSFLPAILSSGAVVGSSVTLAFVGSALVVSIAYLLHVRVADEHRDYGHDVIHHSGRPLPAGVVTLKELRYFDGLAAVVLLATSAIAGWQAASLAVGMLAYSYLARREFFIGTTLRKHFYLYNTVNLVQMLLLQILIYVLASGTIPISTLVFVHFLFTATGTVIFEFLRKVKVPGQDVTGQDTYTWFLGLDTALALYAVMALCNMLLFIKIMLLVAAPPPHWLPVTLVLAVAVFGSLWLHYQVKTEKTNQLMQLLFMIMYGGFNIAIFLSA